MKIFKFHNESGRSMVEMLGTLAIMGLLSVGGISGYTTAMNNHKANEAINDAKRLAMMISSQRMLGKTGTLDSKEYEKGLYTFSQGNDQGKIVLTVQDIPSGVANKLNKMKDDLQIADIIIADNNVTFEFMNDLSGKPSVVGTDQNQGEEGQGENQGGENNEELPSDTLVCALGEKKCDGNTLKTCVQTADSNDWDEGTFCPGGCDDDLGCLSRCFEGTTDYYGTGWYYGNNIDTASYCPAGCSDLQEGGCVYGCFEGYTEFYGSGSYYGNNIDTASYCPNGCDSSGCN